MNIIVFDTETIGVVSQDLLNVGYEVLDLNISTGEKTTLVKRDYLVSKLINNEVYCLNDKFVGANKYNMYLELLKQKRIIKRSIPQIFKTLKTDLKRHNVVFGYAYNANFDKDKFTKTALKYGIENPLESIPVFDIWQYAYQYIVNTEDYITWAKENEVFTESGAYIKQSVESVCKYLYNDLSFIEDHTALSDVEHEVKILIECFKRGCDITRDLKIKKNIESDKVFTEKLVLPNGEKIEFEYKRKTERNGKTTYK